MTQLISAEQIRAARALLGWSQEDLATASGISTATIFNLEKGHLAFRSVAEVRQAFESSGIEFLPHDGLRRRAEDISILQGRDSVDRLFVDMEQAGKNNDGEVLCTCRSEELLWRSLGVVDGTARQLEPLLMRLTKPRLLIAELRSPQLLIPYFAVRGLAKQQLSPIPTFIYADRHVLAQLEGVAHPRFIIIRSTGMAQSYRSHFELLWDQAMPVVAAPAIKRVKG